jgi:hypothetical protein
VPGWSEAEVPGQQHSVQTQQGMGSTTAAQASSAASEQPLWGQQGSWQEQLGAGGEQEESDDELSSMLQVGSAPACRKNPGRRPEWAS